MGRFVVWQPENGQDEEDGKKISASSAEEAVKEWAEWDDAHSADYHIVGSQPATVKLRDLDAGTVTEWFAFGESMPIYLAMLKVAKP